MTRSKWFKDVLNISGDTLDLVMSLFRNDGDSKYICLILSDTDFNLSLDEIEMLLSLEDE